MERNRENAFCCGAGGGNFYTGAFGGGENRPSQAGVREARSTGAAILAVACPVCMMMLSDGATAEGLDDELAVRDISQIVNQSCP